MKYQIIIVTSEHQISVKEYDTPSVPLEDFRKAVGGHIEIVRPAFLMPLNPFLLMVIDEEGKIKEKPENGVQHIGISGKRKKVDAPNFEKQVIGIR